MKHSQLARVRARKQYIEAVFKSSIQSLYDQIFVLKVIRAFYRVTLNKDYIIPDSQHSNSWQLASERV